MIFTQTERTVKRLDVNFIAKQARTVLNERNVHSMCVNELPNDHGQLYTVMEASDIIYDIVSDSCSYFRR